MSCAPTIPVGLEQALRRHDPRLRFHWDSKQCVWLIQERWRLTGRWEAVFPWATETGTYRPLPGSIDPILRMLAECDITRFGGTDRQKFLQLTNQMEGSRRRWLDERQAQWENARREHADFAKRATNAKITLGPGQHRTRRVTRFSKPGDPVHEKFVAEMQATDCRPKVAQP